MIDIICWALFGASTFIMGGYIVNDFYTREPLSKEGITFLACVGGALGACTAISSSS